MNIVEAVEAGHTLSLDGLAAFCGYVNLEVGDRTINSLCLADVVNVSGRNNLTGLDHVRCRIGVYAFQLGDCVIYVGECGTSVVSRK